MKGGSALLKLHDGVKKAIKTVYPELQLFEQGTTQAHSSFIMPHFDY